jgi:2-C-methyl-D-erythritol 4-phosphate cytidylyltransferase/2-C-methyl-D-erythritol 2,4-cyclodiphosphate synthase
MACSSVECLEPPATLSPDTLTTVAIIAAGGRGARLGAGVPKQLLDLGGRSILQRSVDAFDASERIDEIVLAAPPDWLAHPSRYATARRKPLTLVAGGDRRQDSVANAFDRVRAGTDVVVVHDAARPFVSAALIERTIDAAIESGAAIAALGARDTVKQGAGQGADRYIAATLPRAAIFLAQTPQAFRYAVLRDAIAAGRAGRQATDEAELAESAGHRVRLVDGDPGNVKITTGEDLDVARRLVAGDRDAGSPFRVGTGYDLHRLVEGRPLILAGVTIPFALGLAGHSDADIVCHAVTDAVLGAAAAGDIGRHFPDSDPAWKGASSIDLLQRAAALVRDRGFFVENVDVVVIAERPKLAPHVDAMREKLAHALGIATDRVGVKGKTNEGVGDLGRGIAMAAQAVVLLAKT